MRCEECSADNLRVMHGEAFICFECGLPNDGEPDECNDDEESDDEWIVFPY